MKKVKWSSSLFFLIVVMLSSCAGNESAGPDKSTEGTMKMAAAPPPGSALQATSVHQISYNVMKMLANSYNTCNCSPNMDTLYFGSFIDTMTIHNQIGGGTIEGVYLHLCLSATNEFYVALSGSTGIADSTLKPAEFYPVGKGTFTYKSNSFDNFMDNETFALPTTKTLSGAEIETDRTRFASQLTCDLNGDGNMDSLSTVPYGFVNIGEFRDLMNQTSSPFLAFLMGYDPTMYPSVMRVMMLSTQMADASHIKMVKMSPTEPTQFALFLERNQP